MQITAKQVKEFKTLYKERFGEELSDTEAREQARDLLQLVDATYQPIKKEIGKEFILDELEDINEK
jgi:predicted protein tyrosine phosphatase